MRCTFCQHEAGHLSIFPSTIFVGGVWSRRTPFHMLCATCKGIAAVATVDRPAEPRPRFVYKDYTNAR